MHQLSHVAVHNFRSCREVDLALADCTPIVGYNNAGKSNLLDAIRWLVDPQVLTVGDFNAPDAPVTVAGTISGLNKEILDQLDARHRTKIEPYIDQGTPRLRRAQNEADGSRKDIRLEVRNPEAASEGDAWTVNPSGIDNAIKALFPEPITIGAMEDAAEDATRAKNTSTIGKLLAEFTGPAEASHGTELQQVLAPLKRKLAAEGDARATELARFDREASETLRPFFPGIQLHLDIPVPTVRELFGKGTLKVSEQGRDGIRDFTALGHGAQRSIQMALIRYLSEVRARENQTVKRRLLVVEEPELFLHPQAIEQVRGALASLSRSGYQVVFATHSPVMIDRQFVVRTRVVRKHRATGETRMMPTAVEALRQRVQDEDNRLHTLFGLEAASGWLFSDKVLLAEGPTERHVLPILYEAVTGRRPADDGLAIVGLGGAASIPDSLKVLHQLGIDARAVADFDFAVNPAVKHGLIDHDDLALTACLDQIRAMADSDPMICIGDNGRPCRDKDTPGNKKPAVVFREWATRTEAEPLRQALHDKLKAEGIWLWIGGDIEHHLGLSGPKNARTWAPFCNRLENQHWQDVVSDPDTVQALIGWLGETVCDS